MARYSGANLVVRYIWSGGTISYSGMNRTLNVNETAEEIDASACGDTRKQYVAGLTDASWDFDYLPEDTGTVIYAQTNPTGLNGTLEYSPQGTASGKPKYTAAAILLGRQTGVAYNTVSTVRVNGRLSAAPGTTVW